MSKMLFADNMFKTDKEFPIEDMLDVEFYEYCDTVADNFKTEMCVGNDMFVVVTQPVLAIERYFVKNKVQEIEIDASSCSYDLFNMVLAGANMAGVKVKINRAVYAMKGFIDCIKTAAFYFASSGYIFLKCVCTKYTGAPDTSYETFSIVNINQEYNKFGFLRNDKSIWFDYESMVSTLTSIEDVRKHGTVYNRFSFFKKLGWMFRGMVGAAKMLKGIKRYLTDKLDTCAAKSVRSRYAKRMVHTAVYIEMLDSYFSLFKGKNYISGKNMNRYACAEASVAEKYGITIVNYPHGIEFGFKMPREPIGEKFYATSAYTADYFNKLYNSEKFTFSNDVMDAMLNRHYEKKDKKQVVFFSEAHEPEVNLEIVEKLCDVFEKNGIQLVIKLHPKEDISFYKPVMDRIKHETNFDAAITGNICIARRSTTLVEALYNGSEPYALLTNVNDYSVYKNYPSLQDSRITAFNDAEKLAEHIAEKMTEKIN